MKSSQREWSGHEASIVIKSINDGLIIIDKDLIIREFNPATEKLMGKKASNLIGNSMENLFNDDSLIIQVFKTKKAILHKENLMEDGRVLLTNYIPLFDENKENIDGVLMTFHNITEFKRIEEIKSTAIEELDKAFALTLPNSKIEEKLKNTPEYKDKYFPQIKMVKITDVIPNGGYLHVINSLKVAADLNEKGVMKLIGIDKDTLVKAIIFHDIGKSQPKLELGQVVDPKQVFESGKKHAARSASMVKHTYNVSNDVELLIKYHHHDEEELPSDFPEYLLPMFRLMRLIDGCSAGITRRNAKISFRFENTTIMVLEKNIHPDFNKVTSIDLYTGRTTVNNP